MLAHDLKVDPAYLSRLLSAFKRRGLVATAPSTKDGRERILVLSAEGHTAFVELDRASSEEVSGLIANLSATEQSALTRAMSTIHSLNVPLQLSDRIATLLLDHFTM